MTTTELASIVRDSLPVFAQKRQQNRFLPNALFAPQLLADAPQTSEGV